MAILMSPVALQPFNPQLPPARKTEALQRGPKSKKEAPGVFPRAR